MVRTVRAEDLRQYVGRRWRNTVCRTDGWFGPILRSWQEPGSQLVLVRSAGFPHRPDSTVSHVTVFSVGSVGDLVEVEDKADEQLSLFEVA